MSSGTPSNPSVVSFVKYIRPDLDLEEIEHFVNERQGQGDVYEEALNIGKWQTVERQKKKETDAIQNQKREKIGRRHAGNQNRSGGTSRGRAPRRRGLRQRPRPNRRGGGPSRASYRNSNRIRARRSDRESKATRSLALPLQPKQVNRINSPASAPTSSPVVKAWGGVKTFADCLRPKPSNLNPQTSMRDELSINMGEPPSEVSGEASATPRSSPTGFATEEPTPQPTATAASTSQTAPRAMSSFSKASEDEEDEAEHDDLPLNPLLYDAVSDFRKYSGPSTPESTCEDYEILDKNWDKSSSVHTPRRVHETPQFPYTVQSPHKDHRILDPAQVLREFGASQILDQPQRTELPPGISTKAIRKEQSSQSQRLKEPAKQTPAEFKIGLPQNFVATPQQLEDLRNSFLSTADAREWPIERTARNAASNRAGYAQSHNKQLDGFNGRTQNLSDSTNQQLLYNSRQRVQRHVTTKHTQESIAPVVHVDGNCFGESLPLQNARVHTHLEENNKQLLLNPQQYTSISTGYPLSMNNTTVPDLASCNLDPNALPWPCNAGWPSHCAQPSYHFSQSFNRESMGYAVEHGFYGEHNLNPAGSIIPPVAYLRKLWGMRAGETQLPYAPSPNSNSMNAFWSNQGPHSQIKEQGQSQDGYSFYNMVGKGFQDI